MSATDTLGWLILAAAVIFTIAAGLAWSKWETEEAVKEAECLRRLREASGDDVTEQ